MKIEITCAWRRYSRRERTRLEAGVGKKWRGADVRGIILAPCSLQIKSGSKTKKEVANEKNKNWKITDDKKEAANEKIRRAKIKGKPEETTSPGHSAIAILLLSQHRLRLLDKTSLLGEEHFPATTHLDVGDEGTSSSRIAHSPHAAAVLAGDACIIPTREIGRETEGERTRDWKGNDLWKGNGRGNFREKRMDKRTEER